MICDPVAAARGEYFFDLMVDQSWIMREVQTFKYVDLPSATIRTSLTIDGRELSRRATEAGCGGPVLDFPLGLFPKSLFGSFDLVDDSNRTLPLLGSSYDSSVAVGIMCHELLSRNIKEEAITSRVIEKLYAIASKQDGDAIVQNIRWIDHNADNPDEGAIRELFGSDLFDIIMELDEPDEFFEVLRRFGVQYLPIVQIAKPHRDGCFVIKHERVTHSPELALLATEGTAKNFRTFGTGYLRVKAVNLGQQGSQHFRALAPEGTVLINATLLDPDTGSETTQKHVAHITPRWASLYTSFEDELDAMDVKLTFIPETRPFTIPAVAALLSSGLVLGAGLALQLTDTRTDSHRSTPRLEDISAASSGAVIALLLLLPSIFLLALIRRNEHGAASSLLRYPRYSLAVAALSVVVSAVVAAFATNSWITFSVWLGASVLCLAALVIVLFHSWRVEIAKGSALNRLWNRDVSRGGPESVHPVPLER